MSAIESYMEAWSASYAGCVQTCHCGKVYYDPVNSYDWEEGELEGLKANPENIALDGSARLLEIDGEHYVVDCSCWRERAEKIIDWLNCNAWQIGEFFRAEKKRIIKEAESIPVDIKFPFPEGFRSMVGAPKNATWIEVLMENGHTQEAHWAQDFSGEYQPPFQGWFNRQYSQIEEPLAWRPIEKKKKKSKV